MDLGIPGLGPAVRIGMGGSAIVYRARQDRLDREVAVKILTDRDPSFLRRFEREARVLGRLSRLPGIVTVHASGLTSSGDPYLLLEFCASSLQDRLYRDGPIEAAEACRLLARVAATVAEAAATGVVHRDLKPANILLDDAGEPLVADFGIASVLGSTMGHSTSIGFTPGYAAPETLRGDAGGPEVDVYALGATLFHLVAGRAPFVDRVDGANLLALAATIDTEPVEDLRPSGIPDAVCSIIERAMAKDPSTRPSMAELADALARASSDAVSSAPSSAPSDAVSSAPSDAVDAQADGSDTTLDSRPEPTPTPVAAPAAANKPAPPPTHLGFGDQAPIPPLTPAPRKAAGDRVPGTMLLASGIVVALFIFGAALTRQSSSQDNRPVTTTATTIVMPTTGMPPERSPTTGIPGLVDTPPVSTTTTESFATTDDLLASWTAQRTAAIADLTSRIRSDDQADGVVEGVGGFSIDRSTCGPDWSDRAGIADGTITIGVAYDDGPLAGWATKHAGLAAYVEWINANGGIGPDGLAVEARFIDTGIGDEEMDRIIAGDELFALTTISSDGLALNDRLNEACVPHALVMNNHPAWGDPDGHPWTTALEMSHLTEAHLWVELIEGWFTEPVSVTAVVMDNDFGDRYESGFRDAMVASPTIAELTVIRHDETAADVTDELVEAAATDPDVLIAMTAGNPCLQTLTAAAEAGITAETTPLRILPSHCRQPSAYLTPAGDAADSWVSLDGGLRDLSDASDGVAYGTFVMTGLADAGLDPTLELHQQGFGLHGWTWHQSLEIAAALPGGLTRTNLVLAQRGLASLDHPMVVPGVEFGTWGSADPYPIEGAGVDVFWDGVWQPLSVVDLDGRTPPCRWSDDGGC